MPLSLHKAVVRALLLAVAIAALGVWSASAQTSTTLTVVLPDAEERQVDLATDLGDPDTITTYRVRRVKGDDYDPVRVRGFSLSQVFAHLGATKGFEEIKLGPLGEVTISENQLNDVPPPVLYVDEDGSVRFLRGSMRSDDVNYREWLRITDGSLRIVQSSESSLRLDVSKRRNADAGEEIAFEVRQRGGGLGKQYSYEWDFDDGATAEGKAVKHTWKETGTYDVTVTATSPDSEGRPVEEAVANIRVNVGEPEEEVEEDRSGGGTNTSDGAPATGTYDGSPGAGSSFGGGTPSTPYTPAPSPTPTPDPFDNITSDEDPPATDTGDTVSGALLANLDSAPNEATASAARAARTGNPDFEVPESDDSVPPAAWAGLGALLFIGAGAGLESGRRPRLRRRGLRFTVARR